MFLIEHLGWVWLFVFAVATVISSILWMMIFGESDSKVNGVATLTLSVVSGFIIAGFVMQADANQKRDFETRNTDPRIGVVRITPNDSLIKYCDGTTLIYEDQGTRANSISVVANSSECAPE